MPFDCFVQKRTPETYLESGQTLGAPEVAFVAMLEADMIAQLLPVDASILAMLKQISAEKPSHPNHTHRGSWKATIEQVTLKCTVVSNSYCNCVSSCRRINSEPEANPPPPTGLSSPKNNSLRLSFIVLPFLVRGQLAR